MKKPKAGLSLKRYYENEKREELMGLIKALSLLWLVSMVACNKSDVIISTASSQPSASTSQSTVNGQYLPMVSIVVPTYPPRHMYHELLYEGFLAQSYPKDKLELVIFDSGANKSLFFGFQSLDRVRYHYSDQDITLGAKRNWLAEHAQGEIIISFDDDDFYGANYVTDMVKKLADKNIKLAKLTRWPMASFGPQGIKLQFNWVLPKYTNYGWGFSWAYRKDIFAETTCRFKNSNYAEEDPFAICVEEKFGPKSIDRFELGSPIVLKFENKARYLGPEASQTWNNFNVQAAIEPKNLFSSEDWLRIKKLSKIFSLQAKTNFFAFNRPVVPPGCENGPCSRNNLLKTYREIENSKEAQEVNKLIPVKPANAIRIATYNVHFWNNADSTNVDPKKILKNVKEVQADIIGLQEVRLLPEEQASIEDFKKSLGLSSHFCHATNMVGPFDNMLLSKLPMENVVKLDLKDKSEGRCAIIATITTPLGKIDISSVHLDVHDDTGGERVAEINILLDTLKARTGSFVAQMIIGDMNAINVDEISPFELKRLKAAHPTSTIEIPIFKQRGFLDSFFMLDVAAPMATTWASRRVDYIFTKDSSELKPIGCYVYHSDASDHRIIICDFIAAPKN